jgi:hypothetical protein
MRALRLRKEAQGLRQILVWIPAGKVEQTRRFAEHMRNTTMNDPRYWTIRRRAQEEVEKVLGVTIEDAVTDREAEAITYAVESMTEALLATDRTVYETSSGQ